MIKQYVQIQKTARYFISKKIDESVKRVIFVLHGYAQNGDDFLNSCLELASEETVLIAPEGLSKFYWKDFSSNPSSSWMTSLEREHELEDTRNYLSQVLMEVKVQLPKVGISFSCLGFSQGAATASRFARNPDLNCTDLFLYGGGPAHDLDWEALPENLKFHLIYGDQDPLVSASQALKVKALIQGKKFEVDSFTFKGKHKIENEGLRYIQKCLGI
jgi:predicted esterase